MTEALTVSKDTYGPLMRMINGAVGVAMRRDLPFTGTGVDDVLESVRRTHGDAWGDERFIGVFRELQRAFAKRELTPFGRLLLRGIFERAVVNRVRLNAYTARYPEVRDTPIEKPVFIVGFPRTGTTAVQNMLALNRGMYAPPYWKLATPIPVHDDSLRDRCARMWAARWMLAAAYMLAPEQARIHHITPTSLEEDWALMAPTFAVMNYDWQGGLREFGDFLMGSDMTWVYEELKLMFQVIMSRQKPGTTLITKCPEHLWFIEALVKVFPDARIVWTHRDPFKVVGSYCSLLSLARRVLQGDSRPHELGPYIAERFATGVGRAMDARRCIGSNNFVDIHFEAVVDRPVQVVRGICDRFGIPYAHDMDSRIAQWQRSGRADGPPGMHQYDPARFCLDRSEVDRMFADYVCRYHVHVPL